MANLSDIKLMTRAEAETLINTHEGSAEYLFDGWGSKFKLQDFAQTSSTTAGDHYPDSGYIGFQKVTTLTPAGGLQDSKTAVVNGEVVPDTGFAAIKKVVVNVPNGTETKTITENGTYVPTAPNIGFSSVTVNVPVSTGDTFMPYFTQAVELEGTETTTFKAHVNKTELFSPNGWLPGTAYAVKNMRATIDGTNYDYVAVEIQPEWTEEDFDENGNVIFRLTGNYKAYDTSAHTTVIKEGSNFTMLWVYNRLKAEQAASAQPTEPYTSTNPADWKCSYYTYHKGAIIENLPVQELNEYKALIYFKVN